MKATFQKTYFFLLLLLILYSCASDTLDAPKITCTQPDLRTNMQVSQVRTNANAIVSQYKYDDVIEAYVVSSDEAGNFFKTISFQTLATATNPAIGFSVPVDATNLYVDYRPGNKVFVKLKNQYTDISFGALRIGGITVSSYNDGGVGRISQNDYKAVLNASCTNLKEDELVNKVTMKDLLNDAYLNTLVEVLDVQFAASAVGRHYFEEGKNVGGATNWDLQDKSGNQVYFRTSSFANFATKLVPEGSGKVRGVLTKYGNDYQLLARSEKDIVMTAPRTVSFFSEDFETVVDKSNLSLPGWANIVQNGKIVWKGGVYAGNGCAEFTISGTKVISNVAWLISPKIDMDLYNNETLTFRTAQHHLDVDSPLNTIEVYISNNFDGLNVAKATWIPLVVNLPKQATPWYQFVGSGAVDISSYKGKINIAFKYIGSGKDLALDGSFRLDDIHIYGQK